MTKYKIRDVNTGETIIMSMSELLEEINRDRSDEWTDYDEIDWIDGLINFTEYEFVETVQ